MAALLGPFANQPLAQDVALSLATKLGMVVYLVQLVDRPGKPWEIYAEAPSHRPFYRVWPEDQIGRQTTPSY